MLWEVPSSDSENQLISFGQISDKSFDCCRGNMYRHLQTTAPFKQLKQKCLHQSFVGKINCRLFKGGTEILQGFSKIFMAKTNTLFQGNFFFIYFFFILRFFDILFIKFSYEGATKKAKWTHPSQNIYRF